MKTTIITLALAAFVPAASAADRSGASGLAWREHWAAQGNASDVPDIGEAGPAQAGARLRQDPCLLIRKIDDAVRGGTRFLLGHQQPDGSWGVRMEVSPGWNETHMRVPITGQVLMALDAAGAEVPGRAREGAMQFIRRNMLRSRADLTHGEDLPGNNDTPYAQAMSLSLLLNLYENARGAERDALGRDVRTLLQNIGTGSLRYVVDGRGQATFQLALLAQPMARARALGFAMPPAPAPAVYDREPEDQAIERNRPATNAAQTVAAGLQGATGNPFGMLGSLAAVSRSTAPNNPGATRQSAPAAPGAAPAPAAPRDMLDFVLNLISSGRAPDGSFGYMVGAANSNPGGQTGAVVRTMMSELALNRAGRSNAANMDSAIALFMRHQNDMAEFVRTSNVLTHDMARHTWARYYYLPGMQATVDALTRSGSSTSTRDLMHLGWALIEMQARNGSWVDSPEASGPNYGTATAMLSLIQVRGHLARGSGCRP